MLDTGRRQRPTFRLCANPTLTEWLDGFGLLLADLSGGDRSDKEVLAAGRCACESSLHGELADMGEGIGDRSLEESFR